MSTTKVSVSTLMDHGLYAAPGATVSFAPNSVQAAEPLLPGDVTTQVMKVSKTVALKDARFATVAKSLQGITTIVKFAEAMIKAKYAALGGAKGFLGAAKSVITACPDGVGSFQHFAGGSIYWSPRTGAHEIHGLIRDKWAAMGWEKSFLGYPRTDELTGRDQKSEGRFNHFTGGSIFWHPATGAHEVHGAILAKYIELGADGSFLGYPTTDESGTPDGAGRFNHFQAGSIYWTSRTWAHEVHGLIRNYWAEQGWERNPALGYPLTDELIPHRGVGFMRIPTIRKPLANLPLDVVRVPEEQPSPTIAASMATMAVKPKLLATPMVVTAAPAPTVKPVTTVRPVTAIKADAVLIKPPILTTIPVASHKGQSQDRYGDFENGVVFWKRGTGAAQLLSPRAKAPDGTQVAWSGQEIANIAAPHIRAALVGLPSLNVVGVTYAGTANYWYDGAGVHNRPHRLQVALQGLFQNGIFPMAGVAMIEVQTEISLDPVDREIVGYLINWRLISAPGNLVGGGSLTRLVGQKLEAAFWRQFTVTRIAVTNDDPIALLSVKTQADGRVAVYFEF